MCYSAFVFEVEAWNLYLFGSLLDPSPLVLAHVCSLQGLRFMNIIWTLAKWVRDLTFAAILKHGSEYLRATRRKGMNKGRGHNCENKTAPAYTNLEKNSATRLVSEE